MIVFENSDIVVVDKRPGYLSVVSRLGSEDSRPCEFTYWQKKLNIPLWSVHRLDEDVSGLLILAKNAKAHQLLNDAFESRNVRKKYQAWTSTSDAFTPEKEKIYSWESTLLKGKKRAYEKPFGKKAVTEARFLREFDFKGLKTWEWELFPITGRSHQLRYECFKHGIPVLGDTLYGSQRPFEEKRGVALRAVSIEFLDARVCESLVLPSKIDAASFDEWLSTAVNAD